MTSDQAAAVPAYKQRMFSGLDILGYKNRGWNADASGLFIVDVNYIECRKLR